jgi:hypothetical protein
MKDFDPLKYNSGSFLLANIQYSHHFCKKFVNFQKTIYNDIITLKNV